MPLQQDGQLRMLGVTTAKRSPMLPDLRCNRRNDLPGYGDVTGWYALFVPAKTPKDIIQDVHRRRPRRPTIDGQRKRLEDQAP